MTIELVKVSHGAVVTHWFDTGAFDYAEVFSRALRKAHANSLNIESGCDKNDRKIRTRTD
jgi:hypothetical protein